jgi:3-hydroxyacyl-[acyl-carrier-protein] dehydratase
VATLVSPVGAGPRVVRRTGPAAGEPGSSAATAAVSPGELVFLGHYPGFPIFPGVCLIEHTHRTCLETAPAGAGDLRLEAIESTRFLAPTFPGDELGIEVEWKTVDGGYRCTALVGTARGEAARIRLRYSAGGKP